MKVAIVSIGFELLISPVISLTPSSSSIQTPSSRAAEWSAGRKGGLKAYLAENLPELVGKYKSMSRYVRLSYRIRRAYSIYPPAPTGRMPVVPVGKIENIMLRKENFTAELVTLGRMS